CTCSTLSMPSRLRPRFLFKKLEMWACLKPVCSARCRPVSSPRSMRSQSFFRRFSCMVRNFMRRSIARTIAPCYSMRDRVFHKHHVHSTLTEKIHSYTITPLYNSFSGSGMESMRSEVDKMNEEKNFVEFRRKVRSAEVLSAAMEHLLLSLQFT